MCNSAEAGESLDHYTEKKDIFRFLKSCVIQCVHKEILMFSLMLFKNFILTSLVFNLTEKLKKDPD